MASHLGIDLSSYLDDALATDERARAELHLGGCAQCQGDLEALRAVRQLVSRLPERAPSRSLLPRRALPVWLVPARWASSAAAAVFALVFVVSSLPGSPQLTSFGPAAAPAPAAAPQAESAATAAPQQRDTAAKNVQLATPTPPGAFSAPLTEAPAAAQRATPQPRGTSLSDRLGLSSERPAGPPPAWVWLAAAIVAGALALALQWRIARRS